MGKINIKGISIALFIAVAFTTVGCSANKNNKSRDNDKQVINENKSLVTDTSKAEENKLDVKSTENSIKPQEPTKDNTGTNNQGNSATKQLTSDDAAKIVAKIIANKSPNAKATYDHNDKRDGKEYFVIRAFEDMKDHIATLGWYYVDTSTGKVFEWDLINDKLIPLN